MVDGKWKQEPVKIDNASVEEAAKLMAAQVAKGLP